MSRLSATRLPIRRLAPGVGQQAEGAGNGRPPRSNFRGRTLFALGAVLVAVVAAVAIAVLGSGEGSTSAQAGAIQGSATTTVQRRDLAATDTETGTLGYRDSRNVYGRLAGTVTWLPQAGAVTRPDHALYRVEGKGVYLLEGEQPVRRAFSSGMSDGADVGQLNRDLRRMGYDPEHAIELNDHFGEATEAAIKRWQEAHGLEQTGKIELGRIVFQPGARRIEKIDLSLGGSATAGGSGSGAGGGEGTGAGSGSTSNAAYQGGSGATSTNASEGSSGASASSATYAGGARTDNVAYAASSASSQASSTAPATTTPESTPGTTGSPTTPSSTTTPATTAPSTTTPATTPPGQATQPSEPGKGKKGKGKGNRSGSKVGRTQARSGPSGPSSGASAGAAGASGTSGSSGSSGSTGSSSSGAGSSQGSAPGVVLVTTSLQHVVTVALETSKQTEARVGDGVQVTLPSTEVVRGHIVAVASVAVASSSSSSGSGGSGGSSSSATSTVSVEISLDKRLATSGLDQAPVSVAFAAQKEHNTLSIPVTALVATAGGGYAVVEVQGSRRTLVTVTPGLYAGGYVAIAGAAEGTVVTDASQ